MAGTDVRKWDLGHGAWCSVQPLVVEADAERLFAQLHAELSWQSRSIRLFGRTVMQPRQVAWAGELPYRYSGQTLPPRARPTCLASVWRRVNEAAQIEFNHVLCNLYRNGRDHMGYHADAEPELGREPMVACVSLGAVRPFAIRPVRPADGEKQRLLIELPAGSLFIMGGSFQHSHRHALPQRLGVVEPRISLTFRRLLRPPAGAPE